MLLITLDDLAEARTRGLILGCQTTQERIASFLLVALPRIQRVIGALASPTWGAVVALKITRDDLASYLSTSIEAISRTFHRFAYSKLIRLIDHDHFEVLELDGQAGLWPRPGRPRRDGPGHFPEVSALPDG